MKYPKKVNLSVSGVDTENQVLSGAVLANIGFASGHMVELDGGELPMYCDRITLDLWCAMINSGLKRLSVSVNHSDSVTSIFGEIVPGSAVVRGPSLLADIRLLKVAFERSTQFIGEYIMSQAEDGQEFLNLSLESEVGFEAVDEDGEQVAAMRPVNLDGVSFVKEGALTTALFQFAAKKEESIINKDIDPTTKKEINMATVDEKSKPGEDAVAKEKSAQTGSGDVKEVVEASKAPEEKSKPGEDAVAKEKSAEKTSGDVKEVVKAEDPKAEVEPKVEDPKKEDPKEEVPEEFGWKHMSEFCNYVRGEMAAIKKALLPPDVGESKTQVMPPAAFTALAAKEEVKEKKAVVLLADVEEGGQASDTVKVDLAKALEDRSYYIKHRKEIEAIYNADVKNKKTSF